jgi:hypothetical protein
MKMKKAKKRGGRAVASGARCHRVAAIMPLRCSFLVLCLVCLLALPAKAERFVTTITLKSKYAQGGKIESSQWNKGTVLFLAGNSASGDLELVYDTDTDSIDVVRKSDGAVVSPQLTFTGGITLQNSTDTVRQRQTFIKYQGSANISGSVVGRIEIARNADLSLKRFFWTGSYQLNQPASPFNLDSIITGIFITGRRFTPTGP